MVTILSCIPAISPVSPLTAINPFVFVLTVSMLREGWEDYNRYQSDKSKFRNIDLTICRLKLTEGQRAQARYERV